MSDEKTVKEKIRELEEKYADSIKEAQSQPGLKEMEIVYGRGARRKDRVAEPATNNDE